MVNTFESHQRLNNSGAEVIISKVDLGPIPEDPSDVSENDVKALEVYYEHHPDQFPSGKFLDVRNWRNWRDISINHDTNGKWSVSYTGLFKGEQVTEAFDTDELAYDKLKELKQYNKKIAVDLIREARNSALGLDVETPWSDDIDVAASAIYTEDEPYTNTTEPELAVPENSEAQPSLEAVPDTFAGEFVEDGATAPDESVPEIVGDDGEVNSEEFINTIGIDLLREKAQQSINKYQEFHNSFRKEYRTPAIQEQYRKLEREAWDALEELAHKLGGRIIELPRGLEFNNVDDEGINPKTRDKLNSDLRYKFNQEGEITHIEINGNTIQLNRPRNVDELLNGDRPARILYHSGNSILKDDDSKKHYNGYWIKGLNPHTVQGIESELSGNSFPKPDIIDETIIPSDIIDDPNSIKYYESTEPPVDLPILDSKEPPSMPIFQVEDRGTPNFNTKENYSLEDKSKQDPWLEESKGETEFKKMFADSLKNNNEINGNVETLDLWVKKSETGEPPIIPIFPIPSNDNPNLKSKGSYPSGEEVLEANPQVLLEDLRLAYTRAEEAYNRKRGDEKLEDAFIEARNAYNTELERVLKLQVAQGQEANIHDLFKNEVISLREQRITQSQELQGTWEKRFNSAKDKLLGWATKNKTRWMLANIGLLATGGLLSLTGVGIPVAGALEVTRRSLGSVMSGVSARNSLVGLMEDGVVDRFGIKFRAVIPKLVQESLSANEDEMKQVSDDVLKDRLGTLEAYYRLNGGKFNNDNQQKAYEKVLVELGKRVQKNIVHTENNTDELQSDWQEQKPQEFTDEEIENQATQNWEQRSPISRVIPFSRDREINKQYNLYNKKSEEWIKSNPEIYTSELLNTISDKRVQELDKFRRNRKIAAGVGVVTTGILGSFLVNDMHRPGGMLNPSDNADTGASAPKTEVGSGTGGANTGEGLTPKPTPSPELTPEPSASKVPPTGGNALSQSEQLAQSAEATRAAAEQAARQAAEQLAQDVSNLSPGETIWGEVAKQLGDNATDAQIQQAVENLLQSTAGQNSIYELAQGTEGGRTLLAQWGIDNVNEMVTLSKDQLYEISRYLAPGKLQGIDQLNLDNLTPFDAVEPPQADVSEAIAPKPSTEAPAPSVEPTSSATPKPPVAPPASEVSPIAGTEFTRGLSEALGTTNLTEAQLQEAIYSFATSEQGSVELYNQIINNAEGARFLSGFGVNSAADFANLRPDELYEIAQTVGVENLDKLPGFELNDIILSKFKDAPDAVELLKGNSALTSVNQYIANELGNLPYDSNLGKQVLDTYVQTDLGKQWLYDAIVNNPDVNNQNIQYFKEYLRFKDIKSPEEFVLKFNWSEFSGNKNIPTSGFWNQIRLPNGGNRLQPLSTFLKPSQMVGIKDSVLQVLTKQ